jgi:hypothetical protein
MRLATYEATIAASAEVVWAHLTVEIDLTEEAGATTLRLVHHGLPPETVGDHQQGWTYFLDILRDTLSTG